MSFLGSDEVVERVTAARVARDEAQVRLDSELAALWLERPDGWGMTQVAELAGCTRAEVLAALGRHEARTTTAGR